MPEPHAVEPLITGAALMKIILGLIVGFLGKAGWDYFSGGRVEKAPVFVTTTACQRNRDHCSVSTLQETINQTHEKLETYKAQTDTRLKGIDKRLDQSNNVIEGMRSDITEIKEVSAASNAILETLSQKVLNS